MYRILIVDDEKIERSGIQFLLKQFGFDFEIVEASNGQEAYGYLKEHPIDVLLTDVKMPFMDGLKLSERALQLYPELYVIIFSGYHEFSYAKTAIQLGVKNYILKPVDPEEFRATMQDVLDKLSEQKKKQKHREKSDTVLKEHLLFLLVNGTPLETLCQQAGEMVDTSFVQDYARMMLLEFNEDFFETAAVDFTQELQKQTHQPFQYLNLNTQQSLLFFSKDVQCDFRVLAQTLQSYLAKKYERACYVAVSGSFANPEEIPQQFCDLEQLMENKFYQSDNHVFMANSDRPKNFEIVADDDEVTRQICNDIKLKDMHGLRMHFDILSDKYRQEVNFSQVYVKFMFFTILKEIYNNLPQADKSKLHQEIELLYKSTDINRAIDIVNRNIDLLQKDCEKNQQSSRGEVEAIKKYIYEHYDKEISLESLAEQVYLTPSYLSYIFKKETGYNLSKFIKAYRMEKAKELLENTHNKIVNICSAVGFTNVSYFCQSFREYYGVSPERFRKIGEVHESSDAIF